MEQVLINVKEEFTKDGIIHPRYIHTIGVIEKALELNQAHHLKISEEKIIQAAGYHDIAKFLPKEKMLEMLKENYPNIYEGMLGYPSIWHSFVGAVYAKEKYQIHDSEILDAICFHTTGRPYMGNLEKIVFISDYIEERTRKGDYLEVPRNIAKINLNQAILEILKQTIEYLKKNDKRVYDLTEETYRFYQEEVKKNV
jgi:hydrolase, HD family